MGLINQEGWYHGTIIDGGFGQSSGGFPQEEWILIANEIYDEENDEYLPVDAEHNEITAWLILIDSKDRETKTAKQVKKITSWDGALYIGGPGALSEMNLADLPLSFRVKPNTYKGNTTLKVEWVDTIDAVPGRSVTRLGKEDILALQQRYASVLASNKVPVKPVSAKTATEAQAAFAAQPPAQAGPPLKPKATKPKPKAKKPAPKPPKTTVGKCTADDAYNECYSLKRDDVTDDQLNELWQKAVANVNVDESKITEAEWFTIKTELLVQVSKV